MGSQTVQLGDKPFTTQAEGYVKAVTHMFVYSHFYEHLETVVLETGGTTFAH